MAVDRSHKLHAPQNQVYIDEWVASITGPSQPPDHGNWVESPYNRKANPADWITHKPDTELESFWNIALGLFLQLDRVRLRPGLVKFLLATASEVLWAVFSSPWAWAWESEDWGSQWDAVLRQASVLVGGYPIDAYPVRVPTVPDASGVCTVNWAIPYRCHLDTGGARVDGFNTSWTDVRICALHATSCLVANSTWTNFTLSNCTFTRCTFRNCTFVNVHFLGSSFTDVHFCDVTMRDSAFTMTALTNTSFRASCFESVSWCFSALERCVFDQVGLARSHWSQVYFEGVELAEYSAAGRTENSVRVVNALNPLS